MRPAPFTDTITECGMCSTCRPIMPALIIPENEALMESVYSVPLPGSADRENNIGRSGDIAAYLSTPTLAAARVYIKLCDLCVIHCCHLFAGGHCTRSPRAPNICLSVAPPHTQPLLLLFTENQIKLILRPSAQHIHYLFNNCTTHSPPNFI